MTSAIFLDRDGTIIEEKNFLCRPDDVVLFPRAGEILQRLQAQGFQLFIITNQSGVGRGYFTMTAVEAVNRRVEEEFARFDVRFQGIYVAPEAPNTPGRGRKPSPQFLFDARDAFSLDLGSSYLIGDKFSDLECGWNAGVNKCILVRTGYGAEVEREFSERLGRAIVVNDLAEAADWIIERSQKDNPGGKLKVKK